MRAPASAYRQLLRALHGAAADGLPATGVVGLRTASSVLCPVHFLAAAVRAGSGGLSDAFLALRQLPQQLSVLRASEEDTRQALRQWTELQRHWCRRSPLAPAQQLAACEAAAWLVQRLVTQHTAQQMLCEGDVQELQQQSEAAIKAAQQRLDELAAAAQAARPDAFGVSQAAAAAAANGQRLAQLDALSEALFKHAKLRNAPYEWVYDGLAPALLPEVLQRGKGMPLSLALAAGAVARRLGLQARLMCAPEEGALPGTAEGPMLLHQLPPEVAARQVGRTTASAPSHDTWLLQLLPSPQQPRWGDADPAFLDLSQNGKLLDAAAAARRYPSLPAQLQAHERQAQLPPALQPSPVVAVWAALARTLVLAHQRRGESDAVAHWLYQLLALDTSAEEWGAVLR